MASSAACKIKGERGRDKMCETKEVEGAAAVVGGFEGSN